MSARLVPDLDVSYQLYKEIAGDLCCPVDASLPVSVRYELYHSKMVYLKNLYEQCFRAVNERRLPQVEATFTAEDLTNIRTAVDVTQEFMRATLLEAMEASLSQLILRQEVREHATCISDPSRRV